MKKFLLASVILSASCVFGSSIRILDGQEITNNGAVLTLPTVTDTIIGRATTDTLTNKVISGATNTFTSIPGSAITSGTVSISNGGTGQTSASAALAALLPSQTGNNGYALTTTGTSASWQPIAAISALTGDVTASGTGSVAASITATTNSTLTTLSALSLPGSQVTGNISGNAANVTGTVAIANGGTGQTSQQAAINALTGTQSSGTYLRSDGTNSTLSSIQSGDVPTLNQNTTGTAGNITATSNSTLTTLSSLSLPGSQVTGNISGNAGNVTATSNSTLTTLSALSLPYSQLTGAPAAGANTTLSNLTSPVAINQNINPTGGNLSPAINFGSMSQPFNNLYLGTSLVLTDAFSDTIGTFSEQNTGILIAANYATGGFYGPIALTTANSSTGNTGNISSTVGTSTASGGVGGSIVFTPGPAPSGTPGTIQLNDLSGTITPGQVWSATASSGAGHWVNLPTPNPTPTPTQFAAWDNNNNLSANNFLSGQTSTATNNSTITLTAASSQIQNFTGTSPETVRLPVATTIPNGTSYLILNNSTGAINITSSGGNSLVNEMGYSAVLFWLTNSAGGTGIASWSWMYLPIYSGANSGSAGPLFVGNTFQTLSGTDNVFIVNSGAGTVQALAGDSAGTTFTNVQIGSINSGNNSANVRFQSGSAGANHNSGNVITTSGPATSSGSSSGSNTVATGNAFSIASNVILSPGTGSTNGNVQVYGQEYFSVQSAQPTLSSCGTSPSLSAHGSDATGSITLGSGVVTSCVLTFNQTWVHAPHCFLNIQGVTAISSSASTTTTQMTLNFSVSASSDVVDYFCVGEE